MDPPTIYILLFLAIASPLIGWLMWRADFDGMRSEWLWRRERKKRTPLSVQQFYEQFYRTSGVSEQIVARLLALQANYWKIDAALIRPEDDYPRTFGDDGEFVKQIESEFDLTIADCDLEKVDGSFDSIAKYIDSRMKCAA
jgi:hypothetical protein